MTHDIRRLPTDHASVEVQGDVRLYADYCEPEVPEEGLAYEIDPELGDEPLNPAGFLGDEFQISDLLTQGSITEDQAVVLGDIVRLQQEAWRTNQSSAAPRLHIKTRHRLQSEAATLSQTGDRLTSELFWLNPDDERHQQLIMSLRVSFRNHTEKSPAGDGLGKSDTAGAGSSQSDSEYDRRIDQLVDAGTCNYDEARRLLDG